MKPMNFPKRKAARHEAAELSHEARSKRTPAQQMALLDSRLGEGVGAVKERAKLAAEIGEIEGQKA